MLHRERRWLNNTYWTISRFLQFTLLPGAFINSQAKATGPLPISTYMTQCLLHPTHGYYMNPENKVFGSRGDFITSPEISQVFGEVWHDAILEAEIEQ